MCFPCELQFFSDGSMRDAVKTFALDALQHGMQRRVAWWVGLWGGEEFRLFLYMGDGLGVLDNVSCFATI